MCPCGGSPISSHAQRGNIPPEVPPRRSLWLPEPPRSGHGLFDFRRSISLTRIPPARTLSGCGVVVRQRLSVTGESSWTKNGFRARLQINGEHRCGFDRYAAIAADTPGVRTRTGLDWDPHPNPGPRVVVAVLHQVSFPRPTNLLDSVPELACSRFPRELPTSEGLRTDLGVG